MTRDKIDTLVQKYLNAESTRQEEHLLKETLHNEDAPADLQYLNALFQYYELQKTQTHIPDFQNPTSQVRQGKGRIMNLRWMAAAASIAILVFAYFFMKQNPVGSPLDTYSDPEIAAQNAAQALELLSGELNRGKTLALDQMKELDNLNKYLNIF